jgi:predicted 3-demethylubiquinone-9 3-methyltransferase (glyoxalase superfamily)
MKARKVSAVLLLGVFLGLSPASILAQEKLTKEYHEQYSTEDYSKLILRNKYGNIDIRNWEDPSIKIDVVIEVKHSNSERAQKMLDDISVKFSTDGNSVKAETVFADRFNRSSGRHGNEFEINYTVMMPTEMDLDLSLKYGQAFVDEVAGHAQLELKYGKLTANKLTRGNTKPLNNISLGYASGSSITECGWLKANIKYSSLEMEKARAFVGYTSYMKLRIDEASSVVIDGKYDDYKFGKLSNLVVNCSYSNIEVDELSKKLEAETKYSNAKVEYMPPTFESVNVGTAYGGYKIGLDDDASYELDAEAAYGKISYQDNGGRVSRIQESNTMKVYGTVGSQANPAASVRVKARYCSVKLDY